VARKIANAISYAKFRSRLHHAVIRVYDEAGNVIEAHEHAGRAFAQGDIRIFDFNWNDLHYVVLVIECY